MIVIAAVVLVSFPARVFAEIAGNNLTKSLRGSAFSPTDAVDGFQNASLTGSNQDHTLNVLTQILTVPTETILSSQNESIPGSIPNVAGNDLTQTSEAPTNTTLSSQYESFLGSIQNGTGNDVSETLPIPADTTFSVQNESLADALEETTTVSLMTRLHTYDFQQGKGMCVGIIVAHEGENKPLKRLSRPRSLKPRRGVRVNVGPDNTGLVGLKLWRALKGSTKHPFYLKNNIDRLYVDMNRAPRKCSGGTLCPTWVRDSAYMEGSLDAERAYKNFHSKAESMRQALENNCPNGALIIDIHGQGKTPKWAQVGYGVDVNKLTTPKELIKQLRSTATWGATIQGLYARQKAGDDLKFATSLVMGRRSFSKIMDSQRGSSGIRVGPAQGAKVGDKSLSLPKSWRKFFEGGFISQKYGSCTCCRAKKQTKRCGKKKAVRVDAIQLELPTAALGTPASQGRVAQQIARAVRLYFKRNGKQTLYY